MTSRPVIYISAVSKELRSARDVVARVLLSLGYESKWQEISSISGAKEGDLRGVLRKSVDQSEGVIQLVGKCYGHEPPTPDPEFGRVSYTQYEVLHARRCGKEVWYLFIGEGFTPDPHDPEPEELRQLQQNYWEQVCATDDLRHSFYSLDTLQSSIVRLRDDFASRRRRHKQWVVLLFVLIGLLTAGLGSIIMWRKSKEVSKAAQSLRMSRISTTGDPYIYIPRPRPSPTPTPRVNPLAANDAALAALEVGELAFNTPDQMHVGETRVLQLVLALGLPASKVAALVVEAGTVQGAAVRVAPTMEARLTGDEAFAVTPITTEEQAMSHDGPTEWRWNVLSDRPGRHRLHLTVTGLLKVEASEKRRTLKTFDREIEVRVAPAQEGRKWVSLATALGALAVAGGGLALWRWRRRKRAHSVSPAARPPEASEVFISYARKDTARVAPLVAALEKDGIKVWIDVHGIDGATQWAAEIAEAMRHVRAVVLMGSAAAYASLYVQREVALAAEEGKPIVPVELEPAKIPAALKLTLAGLQRIVAHGTAPGEAETALRKALARILN